MPIRPQSLLPISILTTLLFALAVGDARAINLARQFDQNATGACQPALPAFDGQIRKRPLALQNEGTAPAFVSCSPMAAGHSIDGIRSVDVVAINNTAGAIDLTCTLITGLFNLGVQQNLPRTITIDAGQADTFSWGPADNGGNPFNNTTINLSCALPAGAGLSAILVSFIEDVGA